MTLDGDYRLLRELSFPTDGSPEGPLIQATDGYFYAVSDRSIYRLAPDGTLTHLPALVPGSGSRQSVSILQARDGHLYGTPALAGAGLFRLRVFPDAPTALTAVAAGAGAIHLSWAASPGATSYTVKRRLASGIETLLAEGLTTPGFTDRTLAAGEVSTYIVVALNGNGASVASAPLAARRGLLPSRTPTITTVGDYEGDGRADIAVYRDSTGEWFARRSLDGGVATFGWGSPLLQDRAVAADYDGDGATDVGVYRQTTGEWLIRRSSDGTLWQPGWGAPVLGDVPAVGDYDGDGRADVAVYRELTGECSSAARPTAASRSSDGALPRSAIRSASIRKEHLPRKHENTKKTVHFAAGRRSAASE